MSDVPLTFREAQPADFLPLALLTERANAQRDGQQMPTGSIGADAVESLRAKTTKLGAWTDVALVADQVAGYALGYPATEATDLPAAYSNSEYISLLMVDPTHWGRRIGSILLNRAAEMTRRADKHQLILLTREHDNAHARSFYEHKGFVQTGDARPSKFGRQVLYLLYV